MKSSSEEGGTLSNNTYPTDSGFWALSSHILDIYWKSALYQTLLRAGWSRICNSKEAAALETVQQAGVVAD